MRDYGPPSWVTIVVSGQPNVVAGLHYDSLTVVAGAGVGITTNAGAKSLTLANNDRGSTAVATHEAAADPHPQYLLPAEAAALYQPVDTDLTTFAGLTPANDDILQRKSGVWTNRTMAQLRADLGCERVLAKKTSPEPRSLTTTLANDGALFWTVPTGTLQFWRGFIVYTSSTTPDFKYAVAASASPTLFYLARYGMPQALNSLAAIRGDQAAGSSLAHDGTGAGALGWVLLFGVIQNNTGSPITFNFQWAPNTSDAAETIVLPGSCIIGADL